MPPTPLLRRLRSLGAWLSPASRRWRRFLRELPLDPDRLPRPVAPPSERDFVLCGVPRSGTTLLAAQLFQPPRVVTVMEPWDGMRLPPAELFASLRAEIAATGRLTRGKLDMAALAESGEVSWVAEGTPTPPLDLAAGYLLGVKWPAYWRFLDLLPETRFLVCLRHPEEVIASFAATPGRLAEGLEYDVAFNRALNRELRAATRDPAVRRALLWERVNRALLPYLDRPNVLPVRYERWFTEPEALRAELSAFLGVELGPWPAALRQPRAPRAGEGDRRLRALVAERCPTAAVLGYDGGGGEEG